MKKFTIMAIISLIAGMSSVNAQMTMGSMNMPMPESKKNPIDRVQLVAQYEFSFVNNVEKPDERTEETMILNVGERTSQFYSYTKFMSDSLLRVQMAQSGGNMIRREAPGSGGGGNQGQITYQLFKNHPTGKSTMLEQIGPNRFRVEEDNEMPQWEIGTDTMTVLGHLTYKATTNFKGREWTAWFAPSIPRSAGPWKLSGLPGLILFAEDSEQHFVFEATALRNPQPNQMIMYGDDSYEPVSRQVLHRNYERFAADPVGYITSSNPNIRIMMRGPDGAQQNPRNIPFNPIER